MMSDSADLDPQEVLRDYVVRHGLKFTRQRELIAEVFFRSGKHLKVEDLLERVRQIDPQVSLATVYRTMKLLTDCGLAESHRFGDRHASYEAAVDEEHHHDHLICTECGTIVEFSEREIEGIQMRIAAANGFRLTHHLMELYGLCARCQERDIRPAPSSRG